MGSPIFFTLPTPPSTNALFKNLKTGGRAKTKAYKDFLVEAVYAIRAQKIPSIEGYLIAVIEIPRKNSLSDLDNRLKAIFDVLQVAGVIKNDRFISSISVSWMQKTSEEKALASIALYPVRTLSLTFQPSPDGASGSWMIDNVP